MYVRVCVVVCLSLHVCIYVSMTLCLCVCVRVRVCVCVCARTCVHGYVHMCMVVRLCLHINFVLGCVCICVDAMSYSMCSDTIPLQGPLSFDFSGQPVEVRAAVQQYRVQPSGNLSKADIGEIDYTSNKVDLNVSIGEIFPSEELYM